MSSQGKVSFGPALLLVVIATLAAVPAKGQIEVFYDDFSNGNARGWTLGPEWEIGPAVAAYGTYGCGYTGDPGVDADGTPGGNIAGVLIGGWTPYAQHPAYSLESPTIYLEPGVPATLSFKRWLGSDSPPYMTATVEAFNGTQWSVIWAVGQQQCINETAWSNFSVDVSAFANPAFRFRISYAVTLLAVSSVPGWNIDNVRVTIPNSARVRLAEDFSNGNALGWSLGTNWQIGPAVSSLNTVGCGTGDPGVDADGVTGGGIAGVVIGGNLPTNIGNAQQSLVSPIIRLQPATRARLSFSRWLQSSFAPFIESSVEVFDGTQWVVLYQSTPGNCVIDASWTNVSYDITAYANVNFRFRISFTVGTPLAVAVPSWSVDNILVEQFVGQENTAEASLKLNGVGPAGTPGPFVQQVSNATGLNLLWQGTPNMPFILAGSLTEGPHTNIAQIGLIDIGTAPFFSDVFIIFDGFSFPGALYATLDPVGQNSMWLSAAGIPIGARFFIQGFVGQTVATHPTVIKSTAAHLITKI